jgi:hypothetical protein
MFDFLTDRPTVLLAVHGVISRRAILLISYFKGFNRCPIQSMPRGESDSKAAVAPAWADARSATDETVNEGPLTEYGAPVDPQAMVTPAEATKLELEAGHPGIGDPHYVERRTLLFERCRRHRLEGLGPPIIDYTDEETRIWRDVSCRREKELTRVRERALW